MKTSSELQSNYFNLLKQVPQEKFIAVSKYHEIEKIQALYQLGHRHFGESKVQELMIKAQFFEQANIDDIHWHFIGHLQTNKVKQLFKIPGLYALHSIDSLKLVLELKKNENHLSHPLKLFFQLKTTNEIEKSGFENLADCSFAMNELEKRAFLQIEGLMTMGPIRATDFEKETRCSFQKLVEYKKELQSLKFSNLKLSMGMSQDFHWAIEMGTDYVRIGSALFGHDELEKH